MQGVAARYPALVAGAQRLVDLENRINQCRSERQGTPTLAFESEELPGLSAYVASHSRGMALKMAIDGGAASHFERRRMLYARRIGQMNLACLNCHEHNAGRRLRACYSGVRAELPAYNAPDLLDLSLFLEWRGVAKAWP